jgi:hypothetical protein
MVVGDKSGLHSFASDSVATDESCLEAVRGSANVLLIGSNEFVDSPVQRSVGLLDRTSGNVFVKRGRDPSPRWLDESAEFFLNSHPLES